MVWIGVYIYSGVIGWANTLELLEWTPHCQCTSISNKLSKHDAIVLRGELVQHTFNVKDGFR